MKTLLTVLALLCADAMTAEQSAAPSRPKVPDTVVLENGKTIRNVKVVRWEKDLVVLKHAGGVDPVRFSTMEPKTRAQFEAAKEYGLEGQRLDKILRGQEAELATAKSERVEAERAADKKQADSFEAAIRKNAVMVGMSTEQVIQSWGQPDKINASGGTVGSLEQWVYNRSRIKSKYPTYVYFKDGKLTSWQDSRDTK